MWGTLQLTGASCRRMSPPRISTAAPVCIDALHRNGCLYMVVSPRGLRATLPRPASRPWWSQAKQLLNNLPLGCERPGVTVRLTGQRQEAQDTPTHPRRGGDGLVWSVDCWWWVCYQPRLGGGASASLDVSPHLGPSSGHKGRGWV
jgi:hypothetical protein